MKKKMKCERRKMNNLSGKSCLSEKKEKMKVKKKKKKKKKRRKEEEENTKKKFNIKIQQEKYNILFDLDNNKKPCV